MMVWSFLVTSALSWLPLDPQDEAKLGSKIVQVRKAWYYKAVTPTREVVDKPRPAYGDPVSALAVDGNYAKVELSDKSQYWIASKALILPDKFIPNPESEEEAKKFAGQNFKSGRFDKETENQYIQNKGPHMKKAYEDLDKMLGRLPGGQDRPEVERNLKSFRQTGKLGEFSTVK